MKRRRVKITGIGLVTPAGIGKAEFQRQIIEHTSHVVPIRRFPPEAGPFVGAEVRKFNILDYTNEPNNRRLPRHTQFAMAATVLAMRDAGVEACDVQSLNPAVVTGASLMDSEVINKTIENVARKGPRFGLARVVYQGPTASIAFAVGQLINGARTLSLQTACCSGTDAIGHGAALIAGGEADFVLCGGTEAPLFYHPMLELRMAGLSPATDDRPAELCRPFDLWRTTGVVGEGACILALEPEDSPRPGYAFIDGYSYATDRTSTAGEALLDAMRLCLANGGARPAEVDMISAWGPGHSQIDANESTALQAVFGSDLSRIPTVSIKGAIGNPFAAAGAIQVACAALGLRHSFLPPTVNWRHPDPACRLNLASCARFMSFDVALINSHGVSGTNASILLRRCEHENRGAGPASR